MLLNPQIWLLFYVLGLSSAFGPTSLIVIFILGLSSAFRSMYDYEFEYSATLSTGLPKTSSQVTATAIKFDVLLEIMLHGQAFVTVKYKYEIFS